MSQSELESQRCVCAGCWHDYAEQCEEHDCQFCESGIQHVRCMYRDIEETDFERGNLSPGVER